MRRLAALAAALVVSCLAGAGNASAIIFGQPDGVAHPQVGIVRFWDASGRYLQRCSGTMLSARVLLTAAHCTAGAASAKVWLTPTAPTIHELDAGTGPAGHAGVPYTHPLWAGLVSADTHDVGVVVLEAPVSGLSVFGQLPAVGEFDGLARARGQQNQLFTIVGYGIQATKPVYVELVERYSGVAKLVSASNVLTDGYNFQLSSDPSAAHSGGICLGDSGGPAFYGSSNVIAGVSSFVKKADCRGGGFVHRVDLAGENAWVKSFLP